jgi:hypothetical protein
VWLELQMMEEENLKNNDREGCGRQNKTQQAKREL